VSMAKKELIIYAQALLHAASSKNLLKEQQVTSKNTDAYRPAKTTAGLAREQLKKLGFSVTTEGGAVSLGMSGTQKLFEKTFSVKLQVYTKDGVSYFRPLQQPVIPAALQPWITAIVFAEPMEYFV
jgi:subtilase family serine protease